MHPHGRLDTRAWNLAAGLVLTGCGPGLASEAESGSGTQSDTGAGSQTETSVGSHSQGESETTVPECLSTDDCPPAHVCSDGECVYYAVPDGADMEPWYPDCFIDEDCLALELCTDGACVGVGTPPLCGAALDEQATTLDIPGGVLGLSFVDVDDDGAKELIVASPTALHVFESGSDTPQTSVNGISWDAPVELAGGHFDGMPGEDVIVASARGLSLRASDGLGGLAAAQPLAGPIAGVAGIVAGDIDGVGTSDVLAWGLGGAGLLGGPVISDVATEHASLRDAGVSVGGIALLHGQTLAIHGLDGAPIGESVTLGEYPRALTAVVDGGDVHDLSVGHLAWGGGWSAIQLWNPEVVGLDAMWGLSGTITQVRSASLTGSGAIELAMIVDGGLWLQLDALEPGSCIAQLGTPANPHQLAVGDHDGDGDDELAAALDGGTILVFDGEP